MTMTSNNIMKLASTLCGENAESPATSKFATSYPHITSCVSQHPQQTVANFAHRFCEVQHDLEKFIPKIHCDLELIYAFVIKLQEDIS